MVRKWLRCQPDDLLMDTYFADRILDFSMLSDFPALFKIDNFCVKNGITFQKSSQMLALGPNGTLSFKKITLPLDNI